MSKLLESDLLYWNYAEDIGSFSPLVYSSYMLARWWMKHPTDLKRVATIASHRIGQHIWCQESDKCTIIEKYLMKHKRPPSFETVTTHFQQKFLTDLILIHNNKMRRQEG